MRPLVKTTIVIWSEEDADATISDVTEAAHELCNQFGVAWAGAEIAGVGRRRSAS